MFGYQDAAHRAGLSCSLGLDLDCRFRIPVHRMNVQRLTRSVRVAITKALDMWMPLLRRVIKLEKPVICEYPFWVDRSSEEAMTFKYLFLLYYD